MTDQPSLADALLTAADTLEALNKRMGGVGVPDSWWCASQLRREARRIAAEDKAATEREAMVLQLAQESREAGWRGVRHCTWDDLGETGREHCIAAARTLIASGWRKDPAS